MHKTAIWRRLDLPGHDAARLTSHASGYHLEGTAIFRNPDGPACLHYAVDVDGDWKATRGRVQGFLGDREISYSISREADGWHVDGVAIPGLDHLCDLDYGFTPATNLLQLQRAGPQGRMKFELPAAWFDVETGTLTELPQTYQLIAENTYRYTAPSVPYEAILELAANGFVKTYPQLWTMEI